jgi:hypothetical protein
MPRPKMLTKKEFKIRRSNISEENKLSISINFGKLESLKNKYKTISIMKVSKKG